MTNHREIKHLKEIGYTCRQCSEKFENSIYFKKHMKTEHKNESPFICNSENCGKGNFKVEIWAQSLLSCRFVAFGTKDRLSRHKNLVHSDPRLCEICSKTFFSETALKNHMKRHNASYLCDRCHRRFPCNFTLQQHMATHDQIRNFACPHCSLK